MDAKDIKSIIVSTLEPLTDESLLWTIYAFVRGLLEPPAEMELESQLERIRAIM